MTSNRIPAPTVENAQKNKKCYFTNKWLIISDSECRIVGRSNTYGIGCDLGPFWQKGELRACRAPEQRKVIGERT